MSRRGKDLDVALGIAQLVGLAVFLGMFFPPIRRMFLGVATVGLLAAGLAVAVFAGLLIYKKISRPRRNPPEPPAFLLATPRPSQTNAGRKSTPAPGASPSLPAGSIRTSADVVNRLRAIDWFQFEKVVALTYRNLGFKVTRKGGANPDGGIDLIIERDGNRTAVQCKQWKTWDVGVKAVREFLGGMADANIQKGVFVTLNGYTDEAKSLAAKHAIETLGERDLATLIERAGVVGSPELLEIMSDSRKFCPKCESEMVVRVAGRGANAGRRFWGCSAFPKCRFTMEM